MNITNSYVGVICGLRTARKETPINLKTEMFCIVYAENEITDRKELMCWSISVQT